MGCGVGGVPEADQAQASAAQTDAGSVNTVTRALNGRDGAPDAGSEVSETLLAEPCRQLGLELGMDSADENGDVLIKLFKAPHEEGGCQGEGCHASGENAPNLVADDMLERLVNGQLSDPDCREVGAGTVWVSPGAPEQSFLWWKLNTPYEMMMCGEPMPAFPAAPLPGVALQCVRAWIARDTGG